MVKAEEHTPCVKWIAFTCRNDFIIILSQNSSAIPNDVHVHACKANLTLRRVYLHKRKIFGNPNFSTYRPLRITSSPETGSSIEEIVIT